ncbi:vomeronasal type-1 receptor 1 [Budorcas taxicolor]|uniref:vomeronasal type-1 receptor 1 n=1 Tax=Budorcas taxicolor TaxID=37181 RepID=UPI002284010B|nr:vomeronasal type-1 receptor 1 [Budorcas taxicolor]
MFSASLEMGTIFLIQTGIGLMGNISLFCLYNFTLLTGHNLRPIDPILMQLVIANATVLFSKGIPQTLAAFGWRYFLDDTGCKLVFYIHRVATGVSFSTICLFNGFQAIKLKPSIWRWMELQMRALRFIAFCCFLGWIVHILISSCILLIVKGPLNEKNFSTRNNYGYCSWYMIQGSVGSLYTVMYFSLDITSLGFMVWASSTIVLFLCRHKQRVQHICSNRLSPRPPREVRATRTVLILVSSFVTFYAIYIALTIRMTLVANRGRWMVNISVLLATFSSIQPLCAHYQGHSYLSVLFCL